MCVNEQVTVRATGVPSCWYPLTPLRAKKLGYSPPAPMPHRLRVFLVASTLGTVPLTGRENTQAERLSH